MFKAQKNDLSISLSKKGKWYNPNGYTPLDSSLAFIIILVVFEIFSVIIGKFFGYLWKNKIVGDYYFLMVLSVILSQGIIFLVAFAFSKIRHVPLFSGSGYKYSFKIVDILFAIILVTGIACFLMGTHYTFVDDVYYAHYGYGFDAYNEANPMPEIGNPIWVMLYGYILVPLLPAVCEEVLYRGVIMRGFGRYGAFVSVLLSAAMFSLMHGSFQQMILQFVGGVAIAFVTVRTKNFMVGAAMHFTNNLVVSLINVQAEMFNIFFPNASNFFNAAYVIIGMVFIIISLTYFVKGALKSYKLKIEGKKLRSYDKPCYACLTTVQDASINYEKVNSTEIDYDSLQKDENILFLNGNKFRKINKFKCLPLEIVLICVGIAIAVTIIFLAL